MYYRESSILVSRRQLDKETLIALDRELAHAYNPNGTGYVDASLLSTRTQRDFYDIADLVSEYEQLAVVRNFRQIKCISCEEKNFDKDESCKHCGYTLSKAKPAGQICYNVLRQPEMPTFDPAAQPNKPRAFISYKRSDTSKLAADIFYSISERGHSVFLDGDILPGDQAEQVFLQAASSAPFFIMLASKNYFSSSFCKKEIAHAARSRTRLIRVNVEPVPAPPSDLPWIETPNWLYVNGQADGLDFQLEEAILKTLKLDEKAVNPSDYRREGCLYILEQLSLNDLIRIRTRLTYMQENEPPASKTRLIDEIMRETTSDRIATLCYALAP